MAYEARLEKQSSVDQLSLAQANFANLNVHSNSRRSVSRSPTNFSPAGFVRPPFNPLTPHSSVPSPTFSPSLLGKPQSQPLQKWPSRSNSSRPQCQICGKFGHTALICHHRTNLAYQTPPPQAMLTTAAHSFSSPDSVSTTSMSSYHPDENWFLDSGATHHMTPDASALSYSTPYLGGEHVTVGDGKTISISRVGSQFISSCSHKPVFLDSVLYTPAITKKLLSVARLCKDNKAFVEFYSSSFLVKDLQTKEVLLKGTLEDGLYRVSTVSSLSSKNSGNKHHPSAAVFLSSAAVPNWHLRLGHPAAATLSQILSTINVSSSSVKDFCSFCQMAKSHRLPFALADNKACKPFELVHSDV
ncbi:MAG: GAG-pre-integrase domain-containing protein, partial [Sweet potato little leaf phytoplasma]|nr:GAG-pre-integrase domain-containing protein [Sweet potato little leaf phytoplasma]